MANLFTIVVIWLLKGFSIISHRFGIVCSSIFCHNVASLLTRWQPFCCLGEWQLHKQFFSHMTVLFALLKGSIVTWSFVGKTAVTKQVWDWHWYPVILYISAPIKHHLSERKLKLADLILHPSQEKKTKQRSWCSKFLSLFVFGSMFSSKDCLWSDILRYILATSIWVCHS